MASELPLATKLPQLFPSVQTQLFGMMSLQRTNNLVFSQIMVDKRKYARSPGCYVWPNNEYRKRTYLYGGPSALGIALKSCKNLNSEWIGQMFWFSYFVNECVRCVLTIQFHLLVPKIIFDWPHVYKYTCINLLPTMFSDTDKRDGTCSFHKMAEVRDRIKLGMFI